MATNVYLKSKIEERLSQQAVLESLQEKAAKEQRDLTDHERQAFEDYNKRLAFLDDEIKRITDAEAGAAKFTEVYGAHREAQARHDAAVQRELAKLQAEDMQRTEERTVQGMSWGQQFVRSEQFKSYNGHGASAEFKIEGAFVRSHGLEERTSPGAPAGTNITTQGFEPPAWLWPGPSQPQLRTPLFDVIGVVPTQMGSVEYYYWFPQQQYTATASVVAEGDLKPEADIVGELRAEAVDTYAWYKGITRQALEDVPMIQNIVDTQLRRGVLRAINIAAANALTSNADILPSDSESTTLLGQIRSAIAMIDQIGYDANAVVLNSQDWAELDTGLLPMLQRNINSPYGPNINQVFWGLRPIAVPQIPQGTAYVGDFSEGLTYFDRQQLQVLMTDSHADYFLRNKLVMLAEARGKVAVTNAAAVVKCEGTADPVGASADLGRSGGGGGRSAPSRRPQPAAGASAE